MEKYREKLKNDVIQNWWIYLKEKWFGFNEPLSRLYNGETSVD